MTVPPPVVHLPQVHQVAYLGAVQLLALLFAVLVPEQILGVAVTLLEVVSQVRVEVQVPARVRARTLVRLQGVISAP